MSALNHASDPLDAALTRNRLERNTIWVSIVLVLTAATFGGLRLGVSVGLGAALGILNLRWVSSSLQDILGVAGAHGRRLSAAAWKFILRYLVIGAVVLAAIWTGWFGLLGVMIGFCAFVVGAFIEAVHSLVVSYRHSGIG